MKQGKQASDLVVPVDMDGERYCVTMASAVDQRAIMFRLGRYALLETVKQLTLAQVGSARAELITLAIVGKMVQLMPEEDFNFVCDKLLSRVCREGSDTLVSLEDFRGDLQRYVHLVVLALGVNFKDFSMLLMLFRKSFAGENQEPARPPTPASTGSSGDPVPE